MRPDQGAYLKDVQKSATERLSGAGCATARLDARLLLQHALGIDHETFISEPERHLTTVDTDRIAELIGRRVDGEPVSRIVGEREFYGRLFSISPSVLDPRPDTETLVEQAISILRSQDEGFAGARIADIGTGSGAIIVTLLIELPGTVGVGVDISDEALEVAKANADRWRCLDRLELLSGSYLDELAEGFDLIVSNPPYIACDELEDLPREVAGFDPAISLDGGQDGLDAYRAIVPAALEKLKCGGHLCVEVGQGQAESVLELMLAAGFVEADSVAAVKADLSGIDRVVTTRKPAVK